MSIADIQARARSRAGQATSRKSYFVAADKARRHANLKAEGFVVPLSEWIGHNNGPSFFEYALYVAWCWKKAYAKAWTPPSQEIAVKRARRADELGLSYREYALEIMERGRFPDEALAAQIKNKRAMA